MSHLDAPAAGLDAVVDQAAEQGIVQAIIGHHAQLAAGLGQRVDQLLDLVAVDHLIKAETARRDLLDYLRREILPHARAEEQALYPPAAAPPEGRLLVAGMVEEHRVLADLVAELSSTDTPVRAVAAARALAGLFASHLYKENDLLLPLLLAAEGIRLAPLLAGMHDLLGAKTAHQGADSASVAEVATGQDGCGCGGCACGGDRPGGEAAAPAARTLRMETRPDTRSVPPGR